MAGGGGGGGGRQAIDHKQWLAPPPPPPKACSVSSEPSGATLVTHWLPIGYTLVTHWLPIEQRIKFKILLSVFHCVQGSAPQYNLSLINVYNPVRSLRSADSGFLVVPACYKSWGSGPLHVRGHHSGTHYHLI